jgi:hypothetical protein
MGLIQKPKRVTVVNKISLFTDEVVSSEDKSTALGFLIVLFAEFFLPISHESRRSITVFTKALNFSLS